MANASAKRVASQNDAAIKNLNLGMLVASVLAIVTRLLFRRAALSSVRSLVLLAITLVPNFMLGRYFTRIGAPKRDASGNLIAAGEDLNQTGLMEYGFDIIYVTWACQVGSGLFGDRFWWFYLVIPLYAVFKLWGSVISPYFLGRKPSAASEAPVETDNLSKRQEKLKKRQERGDPRVQTKAAK